MKCAAARTVIVSRAERAASAAESRALASHLLVCESCREFESAGAPQLARFRSEAPLTGADYAQIRARVRAAVQERRPPFALQLAFALLATVLVAAAVWVASRPSPKPSTLTPPQAVAAAPQPLPPPLPAATPSPAAQEQVSDAVPRVAARKSEPRAVAPPVATAHATPEAPIVIEIHTADPDVRILWIAGSDTTGNPTTSMED